MVHTLSYRLRLIVIWGLLGLALFLGISLLMERKYSAETSILLVARSQAGVDPYTQAKSAERIGESMAQLMGTSDFYEKVLENNPGGLDVTHWRTLKERERRKEWARDVVGSVRIGASILSVKVYAETEEKAVALADAVTKTIVERGWEYVGGDVIFKQVDAPLSSPFPARPNYVLNGLVGFWVGIILSSLWFLSYRRHGAHHG